MNQSSPLFSILPALAKFASGAFLPAHNAKASGLTSKIRDIGSNFFME
ncbi:MAG: hypothetical protein ACO1OF_08995 [Adhaeribacter sp.]